MINKKLELLVLSILKERGVSNPITSKELEKRTGLNGQQIRDVIRALRRGEVDNISHPIANTLPKGRLCNNPSRKIYFYATKREDLLPTLLDLKSRCLSMYKSISRLEKNFYNKDSSQMSMLEEIQKAEETIH